MAASSRRSLTSDNSHNYHQNQRLPDWMTFDKDSATETLVSTEVQGKIPKWLNGSLYLNGPGVFRVGDQQLEHLLDGLAVIQRFVLHEGSVKYQSRILNSDSWVNSVKANRLVVTQFTTYAYPDPSQSTFDKMLSYIQPGNPWQLCDNTAANIVQQGDRLYALTDSPIVNQLDPDSLLVKAKVNLRQYLGVHLVSAHPHLDTDGTMYLLTSTFNPASAHSIVAVPAKVKEGEEALKKGSLLTTLPSCYNLHVSYNHSFGMSTQHFVVLQQPLTFNILKVMTTNWRREGLWTSLVKFADEKTVFQVIRRCDNQRLPVRLETRAFFCFHFVNCFEVEDQLVVDLVGYDDLSVIEALTLKQLEPNSSQHATGSTASFRRYVLPVKVTEAASDVNLVNVPFTNATAYMTSPGIINCTADYVTAEKTMMEMPRINYDSYNGKKYRYVYGTTSLLSIGSGQLVKMDLEAKKVVYWKDTGYLPGEPVFVPRPGARLEDDGVVLSPILSEFPNSPGFLLVLDAKTFKELARTYTPCDVKMAYSLHGTFVFSRADGK